MRRPARRPKTAPLACLLLAASAARAGAANETLQFFQEETQVITASRQTQAVRQAPMSMEVVTADDIRASGAVDLWDLLRFRAGLDVEDAPVDGLAVVSVRGFARSRVRQLLVLIDGRPVYSPTRSAVDWEQLPVQLQDIERIEIARGPNAALYGSNAGLGVIQIFTRKPSPESLVSAAGLAGNIRFFRSEAALQQAVGGLRLRLSQTRTTRAGTPLPGGGAAGDFQFSNKENLRARWTPSPGTDLDLSAGGSWDTLGRNAAFPGEHRTREHFEMLQLIQELKAGELEVSAARNENLAADDKDVGLVTLRELQYDGEALYRLSWLDGRMRTVGGAGTRLALSQSDQLFAGDPKQQNRVSRGFVGQTARLSERVSLTAGASLERSDTGGWEPAFQAAAVLEASNEHSFRLSYSFAPSLPSLFDKHANSLDSLTKRRVGNPALTSDHLASYEAGYEGWLLDRLSLGANLYYLEHRDLNESFTIGKVAGVTTSSFGNLDAALARGAELIARLALDARRELYANYAFETASDRVGNREVTDGFPRHKLNAGGRVAWRAFSASANLGYKDAYVIGGGSSGYSTAPAYWRLDARLACSPRPGVEVFLAGQNLAQPFHGAEFQRNTAVPRAWQAGASVRLP